MSELADIYSAMDVSVLCPRTAGCPRAVLEAMAARRPVVAARVGGIPEILQDGETGRLIEGRDPALFAEAIEPLLNDEAEARRLGEAAHAYVREHLSADRMADACRQLYAELLIRAARTGR
ncbi:MAG TPA: glycosyltransferase family 4 protein [Candidatus Hydrogenedentes bacterium]|nr:glycosyltransferase family 4 protein [Candidatus Hydrogenedentota bacterium]